MLAAALPAGSLSFPPVGAAACGATPPAPLGAVELASLRKRLLRAAQQQLRESDLAEDVVQETVLALVQGQSRFRGESLLSTYAFSILRNKVADALRQRSRHAHLERYERDDGDLEDASLEEHPEVHRHQDAAPWTLPEAAAEQRDFYRVLQAGLDALPARTREVFLMREWLGWDTEEIQASLGVSAANVWVMLHRARKHLRRHLIEHWFGA